MRCGRAARALVSGGGYGQLLRDLIHCKLLLPSKVLDMLVYEVEQRYHFTENCEKELPLNGLELAHFSDSHDLGNLQNRGYHANQEGYSKENHCENQLCLLLSEV